MRVKLPNAILPTHPSTGLRAVFVSATGTPVWPHRGSDGEGEGEGGDDGAGGDDGNDDGDDDDGEGEDGKEGKGKKSSESETVSRAEFAELQRKFAAQVKQLSAADKKKNAAEKELAELKKKDLPDEEKIKTEMAELTTERDSYRDRFVDLARTNAFLTASAQEGIVWVDPDDARAVAGKDFQDLEISDDGSVDGIKEFIKSLAKRKPHLVKKKEEEGEGEGQENKGARGPSGSGVGRRSKNAGKKTGKLSDDEIRRRFALK